MQTACSCFAEVCLRYMVLVTQLEASQLLFIDSRAPSFIPWEEEVHQEGFPEHGFSRKTLADLQCVFPLSFARPLLSCGSQTC